MRQSRVDVILDLTPQELMNMSRKDLARNLSIVASAGNKRLKRLEQSNTFSPSAEYVKTHGGKFSVAGKNKNQLMIEFFRMQDFMEAKTSSVRGAKKWQSNVKKSVEDAISKKVQPTGKKGRQEIKRAVDAIFNDPEKKAQFWDVYSRLTNEYDIKEKYKEVWQDIADAMTVDTTADTDSVFETLAGDYEALYAENAPQDLGQELRL